VQIREERQRFNKVAAKMSELQKAISEIGPSQTKYIKGCTHSSFGGVFETDTINCDVTVWANYTDVSRVKAKEFNSAVVDVVARHGMNLQANPRETDPEKLSAYTFFYEKEDCSLITFYYDEHAPPADRALGAEAQGATVFIDMNCGGIAKVDYFPVIES